jgi:predicted ABC-type transport system involved in lysophospholipase L1 biosynthesis ATPase subunit
VRAVDSGDPIEQFVAAAVASITVLRGLSCKVEPGWSVGVVGRTGAGESSRGADMWM